MIRQREFCNILQDLRATSRTAEEIADAIAVLKEKHFAQDVAHYLLKDFGREPAITRVLVRAAGKSKSRELHDILAQRLMGPQAADYAYELIDALSETGNQEYAAAIIPFLESHDESIRSTAAFALGILKSPIAVLPLLKQYRKSRQKKKSKALLLESLQRILGNRPKRSLSLELYLSDSPRKTQEEIRGAI